MTRLQPRVDGEYTYVPVNNLDKSNLEAKLNTEDYQALIAKGYTGNWYLNASGKVCVKVHRTYNQVSRLILGLDRSLWVYHKDLDYLNLTRDNLGTKPAGNLAGLLKRLAA